MRDKAEDTVTIPRVAEEIPLFCLIRHGALLRFPYIGECKDFHLHSLISRPLQHSLVNNLAGILLFQGSIGLEVCQVYEGKTWYVLEY